jgi:hypothetical protein
VTIRKRRADPKRRVGTYTVTLDSPEILWEKDCIVVRKANVRDGTPQTPSRHDYQVTVTLEEFRQMLRAFAGSESPK